MELVLSLSKVPVWGLSWACLGPVWGLSWACLGPVLGLSAACPAPLWGEQEHGCNDYPISAVLKPPNSKIRFLRQDLGEVSLVVLRPSDLKLFLSSREA